MLSYYTCSDIFSYVLSSPATKCLPTAAVRVTVPPSLFSSIWWTAHIMTLVIMKLSRAFYYFPPVRVSYYSQPLLLKHHTSMFFLKWHTTAWRNVADVCPQLFHICQFPRQTKMCTTTFAFNPYPTAFPYGNGMVLHFYQQQESSTTKTVHKVINKGLKTYV